MRTGRYSYNAKQRSIIRPIKKVQKLAEGFEQNYDCAVMGTEESSEKDTNRSIISSSAVMQVQTKEEEKIAFYRAINTITSKNGQTKLINASFVWPTDSEENDMAMLTGFLADLCQKEGIQLGMVSASVSNFVQRGLVTIAAIGFMDSENPVSKKKLTGSTLCIAGHAGMAGIGLLASAGEDALTKQYTQGFIRQAQQFLNELSLRPIREALLKLETTIYPIQEGGVLAALWDFADGAGVGLDVDMKKIPIRQESVEISEFYEINPYQLLGDGACLIATREPEKVCAALAQVGIRSQAIGQITDQNARIIRRDDEVRYLDKPAQDEFERKDKLS